MTHKRDDRRDALRTLTSSTNTVLDTWMAHKRTKLGVSDYGAASDRAYWIAVGSLSVASDVSTSECLRKAVIARLGALSDTNGSPTVDDYERAYWAAVKAGSLVP